MGTGTFLLLVGERSSNGLNRTLMKCAAKVLKEPTLPGAVGQLNGGSEVSDHACMFREDKWQKLSERLQLQFRAMVPSQYCGESRIGPH